MWDFLCFRRMIMPILIQVTYWLGTLWVLAVGVMMMAGKADLLEQWGVPVTQGEASRPMGLAVLLTGPIVVRLYAELAILLFRINSTLTDIRNNTKPKQTQPAPPPAR